MELGSSLCVPKETMAAHLKDMRKSALKLGADCVVVIMRSDTSPNVTMGVLSIFNLWMLEEMAESIAEEMQIAVDILVLPNEQFKGIEEQVAALDMMEKAGKA